MMTFTSTLCFGKEQKLIEITLLCFIKQLIEKKQPFPYNLDKTHTQALWWCQAQTLQIPIEEEQNLSPQSLPFEDID